MNGFHRCSALCVLAALGALACATSGNSGEPSALTSAGGYAFGTGGGATSSGGFPSLPTGGTPSVSAGGVPVISGSGGYSIGGAVVSAGGVPAFGTGGDGGFAGSPAAGGSSGTPASGGAGGIPHGSCLDGITNYGNDGPFQVTPKDVGQIHYYVPSVPAGCKVPVVHFANGTTAVCADYLPSLQRLATHGFLTACYEDPNTGAGTQGLQALDTALSTFPDLADHKFGSTGHSQGGQAAFTVLALAEKKYGLSDWIYAGLAMEPASGFGTQPVGATWQELYGAIVSPMFMFSGLGTDGLVAQSWVQQAYDATSKTEEAYFWTARGATHIPVPNAEEEEISIPWFRWKLLGDQNACAFFKAIPQTDPIWAQVASKNAQPCH